jgi:transmembrane sensor
MMKSVAQEIEGEAARFALRLDAEGRTPALEAEIEEWIGADDRRRGALLKAEAVWAMLEFARDEGSTEDAPPEMRRPRRWLLASGFGALAASVALALSFFGPWTRGNYETTIGEVRRVPLGDGSIASINSDTRLSILLDKTERVAKLERGETWFQVAKDPARPFTVEAGRVRARAVGTAFSVRRHASGSDILVTEGIVEIWVAGAEGHRGRLTAGQSAFVAENAAISMRPSTANDIDRALAWRGGRIDLAGESLDAAIAEFNRYNARKLVVSDRALGAEPLYGLFRSDDPEAFAATVEASLNARVVERTNDQIVIAPR